MNVYLINEAGLQECAPEKLGELLAEHDGVLWVDMPICRGAEADVLSETFGFHDLAVHDCVFRNHVSKVYVYDDHVFTVLHAPKIGKRGHVHYIELDQFLGRDYLVTVHGPLNPVVDPAVAMIDTGAVLGRLASGELRPRSAYELLAIRTMALHSAATYDRTAHLVRFLPEEDMPRIADLADRFEVVSRMADGQKELLHGIIEFFQTRISTHMTLAADRMSHTSVQQNDDMRKISAWVAIVAVPAAVTGFFGQNVPYPGFGREAGFIASSLIMISLAGTLYLAFKHKRWL